MKYAFIVLIAIYLVTYGCSPDKSEKTPSSHEPTATAALENPPQSEMTAAPADQHEQAPPTAEQQHQAAAAEPAPDAQAAESEQVVMPCGRTMAKGDVPDNAPCLEMQEQDILIIPDNDEELSVAMQRMVETTNNVIVATRQLTTATYEMLNAEEAADQGAEAAPEQEVVETMQQFIAAAREVIDATNQAIYSVLEEKQQ